MAVNMGLLSKIKTSIRISHDVLNEDIADNIEACIADLRSVGILESKLDLSQDLDPLILSAVKSYCKAQYTDDTAKAARYQAGYDSLKSSLMMAEGYGWEDESDE